MENNSEQAGKVDIRYVLVDEKVNNGIEQYALNRKKQGQMVKKGEAAVELIEKGLKAEGIL